MKFRDISRKIRAPFNRRSALNKLKNFHSQTRTNSEIIDMAIDFKTKGLYRVDSVQNRDEILSLADAVKAISPKTILEIGTCNGGTLFIWSNLASNQVISCDLNESKVREELYQQFTPANSNCDVISLAGDSHSEDFRKHVENKLNGEKVDFLFIDGDHTEEGVKQDYEMYSPLVRKGGLIAFHDIVEKQPTPKNQVFYYLEKLKPTVKYEEFVNDHNQTGFGIGLVHVE
jgi:predicted O-methyltransferase YrrM